MLNLAFSVDSVHEIEYEAFLSIDSDDFIWSNQTNDEISTANYVTFFCKLSSFYIAFNLFVFFFWKKTTYSTQQISDSTVHLTLEY